MPRIGFEIQWKVWDLCCVGFGGGVSWVCYLKVTGRYIFLNLGTLFCLISVGSKYILAMRVLLVWGGKVCKVM